MEVKSWFRISFSMYGLRVVICWVEVVLVGDDDEDCKAEDEGDESRDLFLRNVEWGIGDDKVNDWTVKNMKFVVNRRMRHAFWKIMVYLQVLRADEFKSFVVSRKEGKVKRGEEGGKEMSVK